MRHLLSLVLCVVLAPVVWALYGIGVGMVADGNELDRLGTTAVGLLALLGAGLAYAVLVLVRLSPIGPALAGLAYFGTTVWAALAQNSFVSTMPQEFLGVTGALLAPASGAAMVLGVPLVATVASPRRWRRYQFADAATQPTLYGTPVYSTPYAASQYPADAYGYPPVYTPPGDTEATRRLPPGG